MTQTGRRARVVHAIPGRLRIRFDGSDLTAASDGLAAVRVAPGVLAIDSKPAAQSIVVQYDPEQTTEALVLAELEQHAGITIVAMGTSPPSPLRGANIGFDVVRRTICAGPRPDIISGAERGSRPVGAEASSATGGRDARGRFTRQSEPDEPEADTQADGSRARSALWEMLVGPPPKLDRRFAESLMLSAVSLLAARRVGMALGGGTTLPAYFAIWFALRRMTGLGRRRTS
ncbi:MAG TPA: hypothetical protein VFH48_04405 [Chloroflexota bacterium]|nr:hypothetical protein [Chloroflexota bacterium]